MKSLKIAKSLNLALLSILLGCGAASISPSGGAGGAGNRGGAGGDGNVGAADAPGAAGAAATAAGGGGSSGMPGAGVGGASDVAGAAGASMGAAGAGGRAGAGTGGSQGGGGGGATCSSTDSDAMNCGACGHSCLGGTCAAGICQPLMLGTISNPNDVPTQTMVSGGKVYVFTQDGHGNPPNVWQFDAQAPSTPVEYMTGLGTVSCVMNGQIFWTVTGGASQIIDTCTFSNCKATVTPIVTLASTEGMYVFPGCDPVANEITWVTADQTNQNFTIYRASATGANARVVTQFVLPADGTTWTFLGNLMNIHTDRLFFAGNSADGTGNSTLYYISTQTPNATQVPVATVAGDIGVTGMNVITNDAVVLSNVLTPSSSYQVIDVSLPNGVLSGSPPLFLTGNISSGLLDESSFYGTVSSSPTISADALIRCTLPSCASPTIIVRGQANASAFADDETAVFWTTVGQSAVLWKAAK